ncbi:MAG: hypothetical protein RLT05_07165 [Bauldia litoralis]
MKKMLTASVIVMGVLILAGTVALVIGIMKRADSNGIASRPVPDAAKGVLVRLKLPQDTKVRSMTRTDKGLAILFAIPGKGDWIYLVPTEGDGPIVKIAVSAE